MNWTMTNNIKAFILAMKFLSIKFPSKHAQPYTQIKNNTNNIVFERLKPPKFAKNNEC